MVVRVRVRTLNGLAVVLGVAQEQGAKLRVHVRNDPIQRHAHAWPIHEQTQGLVGERSSLKVATTAERYPSRSRRG